MASPSRLPSVRRPNAPAASRARPLSMIEGSTATSNLPAPQSTPTQSKRRSLLPQSLRTGSLDVSPPRETRRQSILQESDIMSESTSNGEMRESPLKSARRAMPPPSSRMARPTSVYGVPGMGRAPATGAVGAASREERISARQESMARLTGSTSSSHSRTSSTTHSRNPSSAHSRTPSTTIARAPSTTTSRPPSTTHSRTPSTVDPSGLRRSVSVRAPQPPPAGRGLSRATSVRTPTGHSRTTSTTAIPPTTSTLHRRGAQSVSRMPLQPTTASNHTSRAASPTSPASSTTSRQSATTGIHLPPSSRPAFSTYQQHYSPAKQSRTKPAVPSSRMAKAAPVTTEEANAEILQEQIELLQLSLLHQESAKAQREFRASAKRQLDRKHANLQREYEHISDMEQEQRRIKNLSALEAWCPDQILLAENLQTLGRVHSEVCILTDEEGRYTELVGVLEAWVEDAEGVFAEARIGFVERLPQVWRSAHTSLTLKLRTLYRDLATLPPAPRDEDDPSAIGTLMRHCSSLVGEMLRELEVMTKLEREILNCEKARLDDAVKALSSEVGGGEAADDNSTNGSWVPAWQQV